MNTLWTSWSVACRAVSKFCNLWLCRQLRVRHLACDQEPGADAEEARHRDLVLRQALLPLAPREPRQAHDPPLRPDALRLPAVPRTMPKLVYFARINCPIVIQLNINYKWYCVCVQVDITIIVKQILYIRIHSVPICNSRLRPRGESQHRGAFRRRWNGRRPRRRLASGTQHCHIRGPISQKSPPRTALSLMLLTYQVSEK